MLVGDFAWVEGIPGVQLRRDTKMHEPIGLQRLPEVAQGGVRRYPRAHLGDALELRLSYRILLDVRELKRTLGVAFGEADHGVGPQSPLPSSSSCLSYAPGSCRKSRFESAVAMSALEVEQSSVVDLVVQRRVARPPLLMGSVKMPAS